jgi:hypothetical protein
MFKASIVEDKKYYKLRSLTIYTGIVTSALIPQFFFGNLKLNSLWGAIVIFLIILEIYFSKKIMNMSLSIFGKRKLFLDLNKIQVFSQKNQLQAEFIPSVVDSITILSDLDFTTQSIFTIFKKDVSGHEIIIKKGSEVHSYLFEFDSYYMIEQLKKIIKHWKVQNIQIELKNTSKNEK